MANRESIILNPYRHLPREWRELPHWEMGCGGLLFLEQFEQPRKCMNVKRLKLSNLLVVVAAIGMMHPAISKGRDLYQLSWKGTKYMTSDSGRIIAKPYSERDIIAKCAADNGITDLKSLAFVYVANEQDTEVVMVDTGDTVCEVFQLENSFTAVPSADGSQTVRQAFIFNEAHGQALGSAFGIEKAKRNGDGALTSFSYKGNFQFSIPEENSVYSGTFTTGKRLKSSSSE